MAQWNSLGVYEAGKGNDLSINILKNNEQLIVALKKLGCESVNGMDATGRVKGSAVMFKIRPINAQKSRRETDLYREVEALYIGKERLLTRRTHETLLPLLIEALSFNKGHAAAARVTVGENIYGVICMEPCIGDCTALIAGLGQHFNAHRYLPDIFREFFFQLLKGLALLHRRSIAICGLDPSIIMIRARPGFQVVICDWSNAVIGLPNRQYITKAQTKESDPSVEVKRAASQKSEDTSTYNLITATHVKQVMGSNGTAKHTLCLNAERMLSGGSSERVDQAIAVDRNCVENGFENTTALQRARDEDLVTTGILMSDVFRPQNSDQREWIKQVMGTKSLSDLQSVLCGDEAEIRQPHTIGKVSTIIQKLTREPNCGRVSAETAARSNTMQMAFLSPEQEALVLGKGIPVEPGHVPFKLEPHPTTGETQKAPLLLIKRLKKRGLSVISGSKIKEHDFVAAYGGKNSTEFDTYSMYTLPLKVGKNVPQPLRLDGAFTTELPFEDYVQRKLVGSLLNSSRSESTTRKKGNVYLNQKNIFKDKNGALVVPMYALRDIDEGEELVWDYDYKAGFSQTFKKLSASENEEEDHQSQVIFNLLRIHYFCWCIHKYVLVMNCSVTNIHKYILMMSCLGACTQSWTILS